MMIGTHPEFSRLVDAYMTLDDLFAIRDRLIGFGRVAASGGDAPRPADPRYRCGGDRFRGGSQAHDSFYIGSDVFFTFLVNNDLFRMRLQLSRATNISREEFAEVEKAVPRWVVSPRDHGAVSDMLAYFGQAPIIARSSSLLEDSFGNAFAGKYHSEYCANQGTPEERLETFLSAVKLIYASALNPDAMTYRRAGAGRKRRTDGDPCPARLRDPLPALLLPDTRRGGLLPNLYAWTDRIDPKRGMIRLVFGLGRGRSTGSGMTTPG